MAAMMNSYTGLVVCGGRSRRMGTDKGLIPYHGMPQYRYAASLLQPHCAAGIYLSVNTEQQALYAASGYPLLTDAPSCRDGGPMAALLTAAAHCPGRRWLVMGCDYPLLEAAEWDRFVARLQAGTAAAAFYDPAAGRYEPLLAYYSAAALDSISLQAAALNYSLQRWLLQAAAGQYVPEHADGMRSVNDRETALEVAKRITHLQGRDDK